MASWEAAAVLCHDVAVVARATGSVPVAGALSLWQGRGHMPSPGVSSELPGTGMGSALAQVPPLLQV